METCDRCGGDFDEVFVQPNGGQLCRPCHLGLSAELTDDEYNRLRMTYDKDVDFKRLRYRFWALGAARRFRVLVGIGSAKPGDTLLEKMERFRLYQIKESGLEGTLLELIEVQEAEILAENEKSEFLAPPAAPKTQATGRVHAGRVKMKVGGDSPWDIEHGGPWEESQK